MGERLVKFPCFLLQGPIRRHHIQGKVLLLIQAFAQVELLLPALMLVEHLSNKLNLIGWVVHICYPNAED